MNEALTYRDEEEQTYRDEEEQTTMQLFNALRVAAQLSPNPPPPPPAPRRRRFEEWAGQVLTILSARLRGDAEKHQQDIHTTLKEIIMLTGIPEYGTIIPRSEKAVKQEVVMPETLVIPLGGSVLIESTRRKLPHPWKHWCANCREVFSSDVEHPPKCRRCGVKHWRRRWPKSGEWAVPESKREVNGGNGTP